MHSDKWTQTGRHFFRNLKGFPRFLFAHPLFAPKLLKARAGYFFTRQLARPVATPEGFLIETTEELVSYWSFFVERECLTSEWVSALLAETEPVVVDVGANAGLFSHLIWTLKPDAKFILFEPLSGMAGKIAQWGAATGAAYTLHNQAVSDHCGTATFFAGSENDVTASLKPEPGKHLKHEIAVVTLDSIIPDGPILVLKIDVEGFECEVLAGGRRTVERTRFMIIEAHTKAALERIKQVLGEEWLDKQVGASDHLFMRRTQQSGGKRRSSLPN